MLTLEMDTPKEATIGMISINRDGEVKCINPSMETVFSFQLTTMIDSIVSSNGMEVMRDVEIILRNRHGDSGLIDPAEILTIVVEKMNAEFNRDIRIRMGGLITPAQVKQKDRSKYLVFCRHCCARFMTKYGKMHLKDIAQYFGLKHHTTAMNSIRKWEDIVLSDRGAKNVDFEVDRAIRRQISQTQKTP